MNQKRGVALIWALILMATLMIVSGSLANVIMDESKMSLNIISSSQAYANARTGVAWAEDNIRNFPNNPTTPGDITFNLGTNGSVTVNVSACTTSGCSYIISSTGKNSAGNVVRKIEQKVAPSSPTTFTGPPSPRNNLFGSNRNSFELNFDFWLSNGSSTELVLFGAEDYWNNKTIALRVNGNNTITAYVAGKAVDMPVTLTLGVNETTSYKYHARIKYLEGTNVSFKISEKTGANSYVCVANTIVDAANLSPYNFSDLVGYYTDGAGGTISAYSRSGYPPTGYNGDGSFYEMGKLNVDNLTITK